MKSVVLGIILVLLLVSSLGAGYLIGVGGEQTRTERLTSTTTATATVATTMVSTAVTTSVTTTTATTTTTDTVILVNASFVRMTVPKIAPINSPTYPPSSGVEIVSVTPHLGRLPVQFNGSYGLWFDVVWKNASNSTMYYAVGCPITVLVVVLPTSTANVTNTGGFCEAESIASVRPGNEINSTARWHDYVMGYLVKSGGRIDTNFTIDWFTGQNQNQAHSLKFSQSFLITTFPKFTPSVQRCDVPPGLDCVLLFNLRQGDQVSAVISVPPNGTALRYVLTWLTGPSGSFVGNCHPTIQVCSNGDYEFTASQFGVYDLHMYNEFNTTYEVTVTYYVANPLIS